DLYFKFSYNGEFVKDYAFKKYSISKVSLIFGAQKFKIRSANYVFDLILQCFRIKSCVLFKGFKIKDIVNFSVVIGYGSGLFNFFFDFNCFLEDFRKSKVFFLGVFGFNFKYLKLFVYDFYNFFGYRYFVKFYKDYFDFNFDFVYDYYIDLHDNIFVLNSVFSFFKLLFLILLLLLQYNSCILLFLVFFSFLELFLV